MDILDLLTKIMTKGTIRFINKNYDKRYKKERRI